MESIPPDVVSFVSNHPRTLNDPRHVLAAVVIFEIMGPLLTRRALLRTGEAKTILKPLRYATSANAKSW